MLSVIFKKRQRKKPLDRMKNELSIVTVSRKRNSYSISFFKFKISAELRAWWSCCAPSSLLCRKEKHICLLHTCNLALHFSPWLLNHDTFIGSILFYSRASVTDGIPGEQFCREGAWRDLANGRISPTLPVPGGSPLCGWPFLGRKQALHFKLNICTASQRESQLCPSHHCCGISARSRDDPTKASQVLTTHTHALCYSSGRWFRRGKVDKKG